MGFVAIAYAVEPNSNGEEFKARTSLTQPGTGKGRTMVCFVVSYAAGRT